jgi:protoporphyrin/coproporphyrin ferrochelatase
MNQPFDSILLIGFGGPERPEDVRPFIANVLKGRPVPPQRIEEVARNYEKIGGSSPYNKHIFELARTLSNALQKENENLPLYVGMRVWTPSLADALEAMIQDERHRTIGIVLAPHQSEPSWDRYLKAVEEARMEVNLKLGKQAPEISYIDTWFKHPLFVEAICERIKNSLGNSQNVTTIFTAHSLPTEISSPYVEQLVQTAEAVAQKLHIKDWSIAYQSRSGSPKDPWLEPDVRDLIRQKASEGERNLLIVPIGFICDHTEVLFDLEIDARQVAKDLGVNMIRAGTVGTHTSFVNMFVELILKEMKHGILCRW